MANLVGELDLGRHVDIQVGSIQGLGACGASDRVSNNVDWAFKPKWIFLTKFFKLLDFCGVR